MLAALIALAPLVWKLHLLTVASMQGVGSPWQHVLGVSDVLIALVFFVVAAVPALTAFLVQNWDPVRRRLGRVRERLGG